MQFILSNAAGGVEGLEITHDLLAAKCYAIRMIETAPYSGSCHCGAVTVRIAHRPDYMNHCNCSLCAKAGAIWGYFDPADVTIEGETEGYTRADYAEPAVRVHFCPICGVTTHWQTTEGYAAAHPEQAARMGVNMRLFGSGAKSGVELRFPDGKNWNGESKPGFWKEAEIYGS